jgi:hypothetical protein
MPHIGFLQEQRKYACLFLTAEEDNECGFALEHLKVSIHLQKQAAHQEKELLVIDLLRLAFCKRAFVAWIGLVLCPSLTFGRFWIGSQFQAVVQKRRNVLESLQHLLQRIVLPHLPIELLHIEDGPTAQQAARRWDTGLAGVFEPAVVGVQSGYHLDW